MIDILICKRAHGNIYSGRICWRDGLVSGAQYPALEVWHCMSLGLLLKCAILSFDIHEAARCNHVKSRDGCGPSKHCDEQTHQISDFRDRRGICCQPSLSQLEA